MRAVNQSQRKRIQKPIDFSYALRSFLGHLEGTERALHTVTNYKSDLKSFETFLHHGLGSRPASLADLTQNDLESYHAYLKDQGFRTNTRRRKVLTVRRLLRYLTTRKKIDFDVSEKLPAPAKVERVPETVSQADLIRAIRELPSLSVMERRNRLLLWAIAETGALISEVRLLKSDDLVAKPSLRIEAKRPRTIPVSEDLWSALTDEAQTMGANSGYFFLGHTRGGPRTSPISARGIEQLVDLYGKRLGFENLVPRIFRHSAVLAWHLAGVDRKTIQERLGLRTDYAFRTYDPLFAAQVRSKSETTYTG